MKRKMMILLVLFLSIALTTSCWSRREMENIGFVLGIGISKTEAGLYKISLQFANPSTLLSEVSETRMQYSIIESEGLTIFDAFRNTRLIAGRHPYFAHVSAIVIDESIAKEGISKVTGFLIQDMEVRLEPYIFISKLPPEEILDTPNILGAIPSNILEIQANNNRSNSKVYVADLKETLEIINNPTSNYVTTLVVKVPPPSPNELSMFKLSSITIFDKDQLVGYLSYEEGQAYNLITNNFKNGLIVYEYCLKNEPLTIEVSKASSKITPRFIDDKISFDIEIDVEGHIAERIPQLGVDQELQVIKVQEQMNKVIEDKLNKAIASAQREYKVDYFNLSGNFFRKYPEEFKEFQDNWNEVFSDCEVNVKVNSTVIHSALNTNKGRI